MPRYKIYIDRELCIACGICYMLDPSHFELDEEGKPKVAWGRTDALRSFGVFVDGEIQVAEEAGALCPMTAIAINEL